MAFFQGLASPGAGMRISTMARIINEIADVLRMYGDSYTGSDAYATAEDWDDYGFTPDQVNDWCGTRVWDAATASAWAIAGLTPDDVAQAKRELLVDGGMENYTDYCPIYSTCNGDTDPQVIINAHRLLVG
jgi:hypothetical protein